MARSPATEIGTPKAATWRWQGSTFAERCTCRGAGTHVRFAFLAHADGVRVRLLGDFGSSLRCARDRWSGYADLGTPKALLRKARRDHICITTRSARPSIYAAGGGLRGVVDQIFLELVRLGVLRPDDTRIVNSLTVVDQQLGYTTLNGPFWHRASFDGYGEKSDGSEWEPTPTGSNITRGRGWPLLTGERGEFALAAGQDAQNYLDTVDRSRNTSSWLLPEQVWDHQPPAGSSPTFQPGTPTFSATPLAWTHAQFIRLAISLDAGAPVETPQPVACRYHSPLCSQ